MLVYKEDVLEINRFMITGRLPCSFCPKEGIERETDKSTDFPLWLSSSGKIVLIVLID